MMRHAAGWTQRHGWDCSVAFVPPPAAGDLRIVLSGTLTAVESFAGQAPAVARARG